MMCHTILSHMYVILHVTSFLLHNYDVEFLMSNVILGLQSQVVITHAPSTTKVTLHGLILTIHCNILYISLCVCTFLGLSVLFRLTQLRLHVD